MKITISRELYDASHKTGLGIARQICTALEVHLPDHLPTAEERLQKDCSESAEYANFAIIDSASGQVVYEIDDKVLYAIFRVYEKFASTIGMLIGIAKPMLAMLKGECDEVQRLLDERV